MNHLNFVLRSEDLRDRFYLAENVENPQDDVVQLMNEPTPEQAPPPAHWGSQPSQEQTPPGPLELGNSLQQESLAVPSTEVQVPDSERVSADAGGANAQLAGSSPQRRSERGNAGQHSRYTEDPAPQAPRSAPNDAQPPMPIAAHIDPAAAAPDVGSDPYFNAAASTLEERYPDLLSRISHLDPLIRSLIEQLFSDVMAAQNINDQRKSALEEFIREVDGIPKWADFVQVSLANLHQGTSRVGRLARFLLADATVEVPQTGPGEEGDEEEQQEEEEEEAAEGNTLRIKVWRMKGWSALNMMAQLFRFDLDITGEVLDKNMNKLVSGTCFLAVEVLALVGSDYADKPDLLATHQKAVRSVIL